MIQFAEKRIAMTGGAGLLGSHLTGQLEQMRCRNVFVLRGFPEGRREQAPDCWVWQQLARPDRSSDSTPSVSN